uniref:Uncharacterized protein n=1 Tax=Aegilops tauschii TaxID=37682 RepID=M8C759_AEGTA
MVRDVAVCDPLHRRYLLLPPVPQGLPDLVHHLDPFLAPAGGDEGADTDTAAGAPFRFKVMCLAQYHTRLVLHIYSSSGPHAGQWRTVTFDGWAALLAGVSDHARSSAAFGKRYYAHGCFCWAICAINKLLLLDTATTEFSSVNLPPDLMNHQVAFVEASQGRLGMFALSQVPTHLVPRLRYSILVSTGDDDPGRWQKKKVVTLSHDYCYQIIGVAGGYLLLYLVTDNPDSFPPGEVKVGARRKINPLLSSTPNGFAGGALPRCPGGAALATDDHCLARDVAVCDPLHRRYLLLPPVPQDLSDLVYHCEPFLAPAGGDQDTDIAADAPLRFRVMCLAKYQTQLVLFVLSSSGPLAEQWRTVAFDGWSALVAEVSEGEDVRSSTAFGERYYAHGCFCWAIPGISKVLMLDIATMEFSSVDLPPSPWSNSQMAFVEAREGRLGLFALSHNLLLYSISGSIEDDPPRLWLMGAVVPLPLDYAYYIIGVAGGFLLLHGFQDDPESYPSSEMPDPDCFSLNLQTMKLEWFCGTELMMPLKNQLLYAGFPPSLSPPTI